SGLLARRAAHEEAAARLPARPAEAPVPGPLARCREEERERKAARAHRLRRARQQQFADAALPERGMRAHAAAAAGRDAGARDPRGAREHRPARRQPRSLDRHEDVVVRVRRILLDVAAEEVAAAPAVGQLPAIEQLEQRLALAGPERADLHAGAEYSG